MYETPTKPGRPPPASTTCAGPPGTSRDRPWFAIGGIDAATSPRSSRPGATRIVVVRAITDADDPEAAARELRGAGGVPDGRA